jgi:hypothetical protein
MLGIISLILRISVDIADAQLLGSPKPHGYTGKE